MRPIRIPNFQRSGHARPGPLAPAGDIVGVPVRNKVELARDAIREVCDNRHSDEWVSIAAGAIRAVFGQWEALQMGVPGLAQDHESVAIRIGTLRDAANVPASVKFNPGG